MEQRQRFCPSVPLAPSGAHRSTAHGGGAGCAAYSTGHAGPLPRPRRTRRLRSVASPAPGRQSFRSPLQDCRRAHLPGAPGRGSPPRASPRLPSAADHSLRDSRTPIPPRIRPCPSVSSPRSPPSSRHSRSPKIGRVIPTPCGSRRGEDTAGRARMPPFSLSKTAPPKPGVQAGRVRRSRKNAPACSPHEQPRRSNPTAAPTDARAVLADCSAQRCARASRRRALCEVPQASPSPRVPARPALSRNGATKRAFFMFSRVW